MSKWITLHDPEAFGKFIFNVDKINAIYEYGDASMIVTDNGKTFMVNESVMDIMDLVAEV